MKRRLGGPWVVVVLGLLLGTLVWCVPVGILGASNLVWGEDHQDGRVAVPGTKFLHLPAGTLDASVALAVTGAAELPIPDSLKLTVAPVPGAAPAVVTRNVGPSRSADDARLNTQRRVWKVEVPRPAMYYVTVYGDFTRFGVDPEVWLGHRPPLSRAMVLPVSALLALLTGGAWWLVVRRRRREPVPGSR